MWLNVFGRLLVFNKLFKISIFILFFSILSSCSTMQQDCRVLSTDRDAYRNCMAVQGNQTAQFQLGMAAFETQDYEKAIEWFKRAGRPRASQNPNYLNDLPKSRRDISFLEDMEMGFPGHNSSLRMLVRIYEEGIGVPADPKQAMRYKNMINPQ